ncbi:MAG: hypothetical protein HY235_02655 [Acidobacteria bacterium]|nr:hypothetical protein [Acidobacteriota bacterium]
MSGPDKQDNQPVDPNKLVGGYATGNLSPPEQQVLFQRALEDQALFDELMSEQALKELLETPGVKAQMTAALTPRPSLWSRMRDWLTRPVAWGAAGALATAAVLLVILTPRPAVEPQPAPLAQKAAPAAVPAEEKAAAAAPRPKAALARVKAPPSSDVRVVPAAPAPAAEPPAAQVAMSVAEREPRMERDVPKEAAAAAGAIQPRLSVDYAVLRQTPEGEFVPLPPGASVKAGDPLRLRVTPSEDGYLTVYRRTNSILLAGGQFVRRGQAVMIPAREVISAGSGVETLLVEFSLDPQARLGGAETQSFRQAFGRAGKAKEEATDVRTDALRKGGVTPDPTRKVTLEVIIRTQD